MPRFDRTGTPKPTHPVHGKAVAWCGECSAPLFPTGDPSQAPFHAPEWDPHHNGDDGKPGAVPESFGPVLDDRKASVKPVPAPSKDEPSKK